MHILRIRLTPVLGRVKKLVNNNISACAAYRFSQNYCLFIRMISENKMNLYVALSDLPALTINN